MKTTSVLLLAMLLSFSSFLIASERDSEHARKTLEIYRKIIEVDTSKTTGNTPQVARYLAGELIAAGLPSEDVEVVLDDVDVDEEVVAEEDAAD